MGIAQVISPTLGGVLTDYATWRWCFWINLPLGGVTFLVVLLLVKLPQNPSTAASGSMYKALQKFDLLGTVFLVPSLVSASLGAGMGRQPIPLGQLEDRLMSVYFLASPSSYGVSSRSGRETRRRCR